MTEVPTLVKVLAVLDYIGSGFTILAGFVFLFGGAFFSSIISSLLPGFEGFVSIGVIVLGVFFIAFGVLGIFVGRGLWRGKNWARILTIILSAIGIALSLISLVGGNFSNIINLVIGTAIFGYLTFSNKVREAFRKI